MSSQALKNPFQSGPEPLKERDINTEDARSAKPAGEGNEPLAKPANHHLNLLGRKRAPDANSNRSYISPSDAIQSPATQKLAMFKQKQLSAKLTKKPLFGPTKSSAQVSPEGATSTEEQTAQDA